MRPVRLALVPLALGLAPALAEVPVAHSAEPDAPVFGCWHCKDVVTDGH